jgi:hypothetical protein
MGDQAKLANARRIFLCVLYLFLSPRLSHTFRTTARPENTFLESILSLTRPRACLRIDAFS